MLLFMDKTLEGHILSWIVIAYLIVNLIVFLLLGQADTFGIFSGTD